MNGSTVKQTNIQLTLLDYVLVKCLKRFYQSSVGFEVEISYQEKTKIGEFRNGNHRSISEQKYSFISEKSPAFLIFYFILKQYLRITHRTEATQGFCLVCSPVTKADFITISFNINICKIIFSPKESNLKKNTLKLVLVRILKKHPKKFGMVPIDFTFPENCEP